MSGRWGGWCGWKGEWLGGGEEVRKEMEGKASYKVV